MPASRSVRATILTPRSWPSRPTLAMITRIGWGFATSLLLGLPVVLADSVQYSVYGILKRHTRQANPATGHNASNTRLPIFSDRNVPLVAALAGARRHCRRRCARLVHADPGR